MLDQNMLLKQKKAGKLNPLQEQFIEIDEEIDLSDIKKILENNKLPDEQYTKQKQGQITIDEEWAIEKIYKKYKTNFQKAYIDHKVNTFMWTESQMKKKYNAYIEKYGQCPKN
ncbi:hypothetical protein IMG5_014800 [Ichthyophthirius multifiliis]|uniref:Nucleolar protein 16 n=1 Tax=Ichthyophthirius multifiliis TaxID=5932 RepID=G0QK98_ICHMU|nr:hypothetical protein IMG5_014800 [Ichthyophthirius multifiliis]EGR34358.1 hypothetical protein IMG5_014800 [Ichthyophthirius multifiliis]|eukprot:XP_004039662.1 hypothetical protein IMG5_014800 [Ichthyophthirius multifiliis]